MATQQQEQTNVFEGLEEKLDAVWNSCKEKKPILGVAVAIHYCRKLTRKENACVVIALLVGYGTLLAGGYIKENVLPMLCPRPWRIIHETEKEPLKIKESYLRKIAEFCDQDTKLNILLLGQSASGKSSFINSCQTALGQNGTISRVAAALEESSDSVTKHLKSFGLEMRGGDGLVRLPVQLFDCRGLFDEKRGVQTKDIISICDGHVKDEYEIQSENPITPDDPKYRTNPEVEDRIHCVVYVIDAQNGHSFVREKVKEQFEEVKKHLIKSPINIPQLILLTKIDRIGVKNMGKLFYDTRVKECCDQANSLFGLPTGDVLPQANYHDEVTPTAERDLITLFNICRAMERAKDYVKRASD